MTESKPPTSKPPTSKPPTSKPPTQLPPGRYPASGMTIWLVTMLVVVTCAILALGVPSR